MHNDAIILRNEISHNPATDEKCLIIKLKLEDSPDRDDFIKIIQRTGRVRLTVGETAEEKRQIELEELRKQDVDNGSW